MDVKELKDRLPDYRVVDVREQDEWDAGHLTGSIHIPLRELSEDTTLLNSKAPVVFVCRTGVRSMRAAEHMSGRGVPAENLDGGLAACIAEGLELVTPKGQRGRLLEPDPEREDLAPELAQTRDNFLEVVFGLQERYGNREPTDEEAREFMKEWLESKGTSPEEIERILGEE
jgi:rhodanese-related sulfurtransferase